MVLDGVSWMFQQVTDLVSLLFHINCLVGRGLIIGIIKLYNALEVTVSIISSALGFAFKDFVLFLNDIYSFLASIWRFSEHAVTRCNDFLYTVLTTFRSAILSVFQVIVDLFEGIATAVAATINFVSNLVVLLFRALLLLLQLLPNTVRYSSIWLYENISAVSLTSWKGISAFVLSAKKYTVEGFHDCKEFVLNLPADAYLGIVLLIILYFILRLAVAHNRLIWSVLRRTFNLLVFAISRVISILFASRLEPSPSHAVFGNDSPGDIIDELNQSFGETSLQDSFELENSRMMLRRRPSKPKKPVAARGEKREMRNLQKELEKEREKSLCLICQDNEKSVILLPCRHFCMCNACLETLLSNQNTCPVCRHVIYEVIPVYA